VDEVDRVDMTPPSVHPVHFVHFVHPVHHRTSPAKNCVIFHGYEIFAIRIFFSICWKCNLFYCNILHRLHWPGVGGMLMRTSNLNRLESCGTGRFRVPKTR